MTQSQPLISNTQAQEPVVHVQPTNRLDSVTIILPVMDEVACLRETVDVILRLVNRELLKEILIVVSPKTTEESLKVVRELQDKLAELVVVHRQKLPFLGGAIREAFDLARGSHVLMMASDLETDPKELPALIANAQANPSAIVTTTRWRGGIRFQGYQKVKLVCNYLFQKFFSILYGTHLSDMTFGYRIFPTRVVQTVKWEELRHPFLFETIVKPLRLGVTAIEIPTSWRPRPEGRSQNPFFRNFAYFQTGFRVRFAPKSELVRKDFRSESPRLTAHEKSHSNHHD